MYFVSFKRDQEYAHIRGVNSLSPRKGFSGYNTKPHPVMMFQLWTSSEYGVTHLLLLLPATLQPGVVLLIKVSFKGQTENYLY